LICGAVVSLLSLVCGVAGGPRHAGAGEARYVYDSLNRLIAVSDETGDTAVYRYDAVGNLLAITRHGANDVLILDFVPQRGIPGTIVTIRGANFSPDPGQNQVTFNGRGATVQTASDTQLRVTVPAGATTGPIAITAPLGSALSAEPFVVLPSVSAVNPSFGMQGATVDLEVIGENLAGATELRFAPSDGISVTGSLVVNAAGTLVTARITIAAGAPLGERHVTVVTPTGSSASTTPDADEFVILSNEPITQVSAGVRVLVEPLPNPVYAPPVKVQNP
jgi:YD repeat-containing protein